MVWEMLQILPEMEWDLSCMPTMHNCSSGGGGGEFLHPSFLLMITKGLCSCYKLLNKYNILAKMTEHSHTHAQPQGSIF